MRGYSINSIKTLIYSVNKPVTKREVSKKQRQWAIFLKATFFTRKRTKREIYQKNISLLTGDDMSKSFFNKKLDIIRSSRHR